jgi:hypothetical protein
MDERHWWMTSKLLESFSNDELEGKSLVEEFMTTSSTVETINLFLNEDADKVLIFCTIQKNEKKCLTFGNSTLLASILQDNDNHQAIVYFLKRPRIHKVSTADVEQEILCGEIKQSAIISFCDLIQNNIMNIIQKNLIGSNISFQESKNFLSDMNKYAEMLIEFANAADIPQQILNIPKDQSIGSFRKSRQTTLNPTVIAEYESYLQGWMNSIEVLLTESMDERYAIF